MARGPLPKPDARRRNAPTIPTTRLPVEGYRGEVPEPAYELADAGARWWAWAWSLPQAAAWDDGGVYALSRRAQLEDDLAALDFEDHVDLDDLLAGVDDRDAVRQVEWALSKLKQSASGKLAIEKEMRELDRRFGLDPKALAELRWQIVKEPAARESSPTSATPAPPSRSATGNVRRLRAVDPQAAAG